MKKPGTTKNTVLMTTLKRDGGTLSSTSYKRSNVCTLFNKHQRQKNHMENTTAVKSPSFEIKYVQLLITIVGITDQTEGVHKSKVECSPQQNELTLSRQFFFVITTTASTRCLAEIFDRSYGCTGETLLAPCVSKKAAEKDKTTARQVLKKILAYLVKSSQ